MFYVCDDNDSVISYSLATSILYAFVVRRFGVHNRKKYIFVYFLNSFKLYNLLFLVMHTCVRIEYADMKM